ncbi:MAG: hypothetical protein KIT84_28565 [Labilithrix sp.]|nr:hypothetical protein [Labilithrix sp.]MCW5815013.1 hypothetical protein [Labilithrix sp.]
MRVGRRPLVLGAFAAAALGGGRARADDEGENARARWLAGLEPPRAFEASAEWRAFAQTETERWQATAPRIKAMEDWSARELASLPFDRPVVYPFAGPDALHAVALFGKAKRLFLVGLEPVGALPDAARAPAAGYFTRLGAAQADLHRLGFFRTQEMASDFAREGVVAALAGTIARLGGKIASVQLGATPPSARIDWINKAGEARRLDYVQTDLANTGLKAQAQLVADIHALAPYVTFLKAAMYLLGEARFSYLRQTILDESAVVLQDDTGVPLRCFDARWAMRFYGAYEPPPPAYADRAESDLKVALEHRSVAALPFGFGYHVQPAKACLVVATKGK